MTRLLHIDSSARPHGSDRHAHGSHTRRLSARFIQCWQALRPQDPVVYRDVGQSPPAPVTGAWIHAAFTPADAREPWMREALAESDALVDELLAADVIVVGLPMYNFNVPAQFKAYVDNVVRVGRTFGFDRSRGAEPYWPLLAEAGKTLVLLGSRGDYGYAEGGRLGRLNHGEASVRTAFGYLGIVDVHGVAIEYDEFADARLRASIAEAEAGVDALAERLAAQRGQRAAA
ncbi:MULTISPECIES: NAD(P)H-dependent oxidoreductase [unclassified Lysobacter]|uniref:FMN-dependent NADH-azoreductase n=1 Tax=unclassified Lysobacter TaxID=2635362 RepID=UPI0006F3F56C|nr:MULTISPECIES: NAD(P)H-dependent oxidoreductase [unclassified Lysobacter]KQZ56962.1 NAD(P)H dehydrogenase [Lysobacter sp. Root559]KRC34804.1 NAD(P)H dehydrogenase [Lysobacter sp. Root76]KRD70493.1 NAD(P)H dehydrogenase [Lysobacter sp. Root96]